MNRFLKNIVRFILLHFLPLLLILLAGYVYYDPFKVVHKFDAAGFRLSESVYVPVNNDYVSTELFLQNYPTHQYNSFIFGSSRSGSYFPSTWKKYLKETDMPFNFGAAAENLSGICNKLKFLEARNVKLDNVIIILCRDWSFMDDFKFGRKHLFMKHPLVSGENKLSYYGKYLDAYFDKKFLLAFYNYQFTHQYKEWMSAVFMTKVVSRDLITNEGHMVSLDSEIAANPAGYYQHKPNIFYKRPGEQIDTVIRITDHYFSLLTEIKNILEKHHSAYKIVCSPLYDQIKYSSHDKQLLTGLFGAHLYDFTGKNDLTEPATNYYESSHYRPLVGDSVLSRIYQKN
mgnify:FL=1